MAADHADHEAEEHVEGQRQKLVVQDGGNGENGAAQHGPAGTDEQTKKNDGFKGDVGSEKVGNPEPKPDADRERHQKKRQQSQRLRGAALFRKEQPPEGGNPRQHAGH